MGYARRTEMADNIPTGTELFRNFPSASNLVKQCAWRILKKRRKEVQPAAMRHRQNNVTQTGYKIQVVYKLGYEDAGVKVTFSRHAK